MSDISPASSGCPFPSLDEYGFDGLSIQSVGYTLGAEEEAVHVYVTRGSKRSLAELLTRVGDVQIEVINLGKVDKKPEAAYAAVSRGNVYQRNGRIACGSSCAPAGENYSGTFGALVYSSVGVMALSNNHVFAACNHIALGQPILSPSSNDARPNVPAPRELCRHSGIVELRSGTPDLVPLAGCGKRTRRTDVVDGASSRPTISVIL